MELSLPRRNEDSVGRCEFGSCKKPVFAPKSKYCGLLHRDLYMADMYTLRVDGTLPQRSLHELEKCNLPGCEEAKYFDSSTGDTLDFCRRLHAFKYMELKTRQWKEDGRLCQFSDCTSHVHVENGTRIHDFCSLRHAAMAARARGLSKVAVQPVPVPANKESLQRGYQFNPKKELEIVKELQESIRAGRTDGGAFQHFETGVDPLKFHPGEIVDAKKKMPRYFLTMGGDSKLPQQLTTKENFHWKQSSKPGSKHAPDPADGGSPGGSLQKRYYTYRNTKLEKHPCQHEGSEGTVEWRLHRTTVQSEGSKCLFVIWKIFQSTKRKSKTRNDDSNQVSAVDRELEGVSQEGPELDYPLSSRAASPVLGSHLGAGVSPDYSTDEMQGASKEQAYRSLSGMSSSDPEMHAHASAIAEWNDFAMQEVPDSEEQNFAQNDIVSPRICCDESSQLSLDFSDEQSTHAQSFQIPSDHNQSHSFLAPDPKIWSPVSHYSHGTTVDYLMDSDDIEDDSFEANPFEANPWPGIP